MCVDISAADCRSNNISLLQINDSRKDVNSCVFALISFVKSIAGCCHILLFAVTNMHQSEINSAPVIFNRCGVGIEIKKSLCFIITAERNDKMLGIFVYIKKGIVLKICPVYHHVLKLSMMSRSEFERLLVGSFINKRLSVCVDDNEEKGKQNRQNSHDKSRFIRQLTAGGINIFSS